MPMQFNAPGFARKRPWRRALLYSVLLCGGAAMALGIGILVFGAFPWPLNGVINLVPLYASLAGPPDVSWDPSPDGRTVAYSAAGNGYSDLYLVNPSTMAVRRLTDSPDTEADPAFLPDGHHIIYSSAPHPEGESRLYIRSLDDGTVRQLTHGHGTSDFYPHPSADGRIIFFTRAEQYNPPPGMAGRWLDKHVYSVNIDGSGLRRNDDHQAHKRAQGVISPDGRSEVYIRDKAVPYEYEVWIRSADGSHARQLTHLQTYLGTPRFTPDGRHIWFLTDPLRHRRPALMEMDLNGEGVHTLVPEGVWCR